MSEEKTDQGKKLGELITKAWSDDAFKARLLSDTTAVLKENGISVPEGLTVKAVENTDKVVHILIPPKPSTDELSEVDLANLAGGSWCVFDWFGYRGLRICGPFVGRN